MKIHIISLRRRHAQVIIDPKAQGLSHRRCIRPQGVEQNAVAGPSLLAPEVEAWKVFKLGPLFETNIKAFLFIGARRTAPKTQAPHIEFRPVGRKHHPERINDDQT